jgi:hypothetical protein
MKWLSIKPTTISSKIVYHLIWLRIKITLSFCCCPRQNVIVRLHPGVGFFLLEVLPLKKD